MRVYIDLILVSLITIYIVDLSGFTDSWRNGLARILKVKNLRPLPPFDCAKCMTWWICVFYAFSIGHLSLATMAFSALMSFLSIPVGQILMLMKETIVKITNYFFDKL